MIFRCTNLRKFTKFLCFQVVRTSFISTKQGIDLASRIGAASYVECSSVSDCGIDDLKGDIVMASQMGMEAKCSKQTKCCSCKII